MYCVGLIPHGAILSRVSGKPCMEAFLVEHRHYSIYRLVNGQVLPRCYDLFATQCSLVPSGVGFVSALEESSWSPQETRDPP